MTTEDDIERRCRHCGAQVPNPFRYCPMSAGVCAPLVVAGYRAAVEEPIMGADRNRPTRLDGLVPKPPGDQTTAAQIAKAMRLLEAFEIAWQGANLDTPWQRDAASNSMDYEAQLLLRLRAAMDDKHG